MKGVRRRALAVLAIGSALTWAMPLAGLLASGRPVARYIGFPPRTAYAPHAAFSWTVFSVLCLPVFAVVALYAVALARARPRAVAEPSRSFPWWGWAGLALIAIGWTLAWSGGFLPVPWRTQTFTLLWLGYVLVLNGLARRRTGRALLTEHPRWFLALFPVSAGYWWLFEYLNQFVANWSYGGVRASDTWCYFIQASVPFSTVLPAVASTWAWLALHPRLDAPALPALRAPRGLAWPALAAGILVLAGLGLWPQALFPFLWIGPLLVLAALQRLLTGEALLAPLARGDWRPLLQPALAALMCGFFWELWNFGSLAKWRYSIPYVGRFHVFEMPLLGYAGYLPFGIECALVLDLLARLVDARGVAALLELRSTGRS
jgi:hypothetical protein